MKLRIFTYLTLLALLHDPVGLIEAHAEPSGDLAQGPVAIAGERGLHRFLHRVRTEGRAHVAFLGGSITESPQSHAKLVGDWMQQRWPEAVFTFSNAGLASTCSVTGAFRLNEDVLSSAPVDLLVVEFAVNDDQDAGYDHTHATRGMEGIVRQFLDHPQGGDVLMIHYVNPSMLAAWQAGKTPVSVAAHESVAAHYALPRVNVGLALAREIQAGNMTWEADYADTHPNAAGYAFASRLVTDLIHEIEEATPQASGKASALPEPLDDLSYFGAKVIQVEEVSWLGGWTAGLVSRELLPLGSIRKRYEGEPALRSNESGNYLYVNFSGSMLGAFVLAGPDSGQVEVSVDGGDWQAVDLFHAHSGGLNYPRSVRLADHLSKGPHQAAIRVSARVPEGSQGTTATFLYFQVNR